MNPIIFGKPSFTDEYDAIKECFERNWLGRGPKVTEFEIKFAETLGVDEVVMVSSCTAALHLALLDAGIGIGDEVICPAMTFVATSNSILYTGATPVLADIDTKTLNIDPQSIRKKITKSTRAIIAVHFAGKICDMDAIKKICEEFNIILIEDCAHAYIAKRNGKNAGTFGDYACFSFYSNKNITSIEGGAIVKNREGGMDKIRKLAQHGMSTDAWKRFHIKGYGTYDVDHLGYKYNQTDVNASVGIRQLEKYSLFSEVRRNICTRYAKELRFIDCEHFFHEGKNEVHACHLFPVLFHSGALRMKVIESFQELNIGFGFHYRSIDKFTHYNKNYSFEDLEFSNKYGENCLSLPVGNTMTNEEISFVIDTFNGCT